MYIFKVKVISGICFKQTFLCVEQLYHISLKYKLYVVYVSKKKILCTEELCHIFLKYKLYLVYVSNKFFFVLKNYTIYLYSISHI